MMMIVFYIAITLTIFLVLALLGAPIILKPSVAARRILEAVQSTRPDEREVGTNERIQNAILSLAKSMRHKLAIGEDDSLRKKMSAAGLKGTGVISLYLSSRFLTPLVGFIGGSFIHTNTLFWTFSFAAVGYMLPSIWLLRMATKRKEKIMRGLPDALDLMVICVEAGLGLDQAMLRVGQELVISHPEINQEFTQINLEQQAGKARLEAWSSAALRTDVSEFSLFVTMLIQADKFGTPIIRALSRFGDELRMKRRQRAEELAAKTKIKILFPLVLFIFPCIFVVLLAPAILNISKSLQIFR
jgi:tight adherence protein C